MTRARLVPLASLLLATACATAPAPRPLPAGDARPAALLGALAREAEARRALRGVARLALDGPAGSGRAKQVVLAERPARLRVEVLGFLDQTVAVLVTDGRRYRLFRAEERTVTEGAVHDGLLLEVTGLALTPEQAVRVLLAVPPVPEDARIVGGALLGAGGVRVELAAPREPARVALDFDADARLRRWEVRAADGAPRWEARFDDYRAVAGGEAAHRIELRDHATGTGARVSFGALELNPSLPGGAFTLDAGGHG